MPKHDLSKYQSIPANLSDQEAYEMLVLALTQLRDLIAYNRALARQLDEIETESRELRALLASRAQ